MADDTGPVATRTTDVVRDALVEHTAPQRLVAQRTLFDGPSPLVPTDLYAQVTLGIADRERSTLSLQPYARVTTNTYFGRFPASYWQRWTAVQEVEVSATVHGAGRMAVMASDVDGERRTVASADIRESGKVSLTARIDRFLDGGALWVEWETGASELRVDEMAWTVPPPESIRPVAMVICTYNRADECIDTLEAIAGDPGLLQYADAVYVVDQGTDRVDSREGFARVAASLGDRLVYLTQPNLGGAGGFTRGLYEVTGVAGAEHANVIFMDDDILCEPETIARVNAFANLTVEPTIVGAQMLNLLHPEQLHVGAETADLPKLGAGIASPRALSSEDVTEEHQEERVDAGYNGWWSCLIPAEIVAAVGYPLPLFFQWDDIEYGFRTRAAGFATVTLAGAGVWHADFGWKDWDDWHRYFNLRNAMVTAALHSPFEGKPLSRQLLLQLGRYLLSMQYGLAHTLIKAVEDFSAGPDMLHDGGVSAAAEIRKERAEYPETVRHPASAVPGIRAADASIEVAAPPPSAVTAVIGKRVLAQLRGRTLKHPVSIPAAEAVWYHVSRFETVVVTDASQEGVRVRRRDPERAKALLVRGVRACRELARRAPELREQYRAAMPTLTSRENWARLFGQD
ncbi:glycosyltransferase [Blastococcus sp. TF02A-26]|uniref:glycosyltransferase n=1 Tax=Blastococcus sp. TF02A-26 TaxID=2250577 RepID=UPI000DE8479C|nr:glycosyltransferase [Blastococcus sp. TF02A-26]RBY89849.1 glycosyltransferase family 2 protein [Blastococcus sp. TF02A-26]